MEKENQWEYDYTSAQHSSADTGYINVGSSGTNSANRYAAEDVPVSRTPVPMEGGSTPPPSGPEDDRPPRGGKRRRRGNIKKVLFSAAALALAAVMGFVGGYVGGQMSGSKVIVQTVERPAASGSGTMSTASTSSSLSTAQVAALVSPSVVVITTEQVVYSQWSWYGQNQVQSGAGSGVIISSDGYIVTCAHVVSGASNISVTVGEESYTASVVGEDAASDIAVIKIEADGLTPAVIGDSDALVVGEEVLAVGNPLGKLGGTVTNGIISALNRSVSIQSSDAVLDMSLIQTNASVSPGNSGGGLFNMSGELVGIVNAKSSDSEAEGLGFAIPINDAIAVAQELLENGYVSGRPYLGITYMDVNSAQMAQQLGVSSYGIYVAEVVKGGPADRAGLQAGDRIVSMDNQEINNKTDLNTEIQKHLAGETISVTVARSGQMVTMELTLGDWNEYQRKAG
ncbi:MAG: S1C family serine protease [Faecalibacterium sp.]